MIGRLLWGKHLNEKSAYLSVFAAAVAFYFLLSLVPFLVLVMTVLEMVIPLSPEASILKTLEAVVPEDSHAILERMVTSAEQASGGGLLTATFAVAAYTSANFMFTLVRALRFVFSGKDTNIPFWSSLGQSLALIVVWGAGLGASSVFLVLAPGIESLLRELHLLSEPVAALWGWAKHGVLLLLLFMAILMTYTVTSLKRYSTQALFLAALFASFAWLGVGYVFSNVLPAFWQSNMVYGALGSIVITIFWAYASAWVVILGAVGLVRFAGPAEAPIARKPSV